jgi:MFS family permease
VIGASVDVSWFVVGAGILAVSTAMSGPAPAAFAADHAREEIRGLSLGIFRTGGDLGLLLGPPLLGFIADVGGYGAAFGVNAVIVAAAAGVFYLATRVTPGAAEAAR